MAFEIERGLFTSEFTDHHAVIGISVDADAKAIRKRYLRLARKLHPDSVAASGQTDQADLAQKIFSKLVGPSYNMLQQERERKEYLLLIQLKAKQAVQQRLDTSQFKDAAGQLMQSLNWQEDYTQLLDGLVNKQFDDLTQTLALTGEISELNLAYLMRKEGAGSPGARIPMGRPSPPAATASRTTPAPAQSGPNTVARTRPAAQSGPATVGSTTAFNTAAAAGTTVGSTQGSNTMVDGYLRRAEEYLAKNLHAKATLELRDALRIAPNDSRCHSLMGLVYVKQRQATMAKTYTKRALDLNPNDKRALEVKATLEKMGQPLDSGSKAGKAAKPGSTRSSSKSSSSSTRKTKPGQSNSGGGGLFGGLFGGKKK
ncbi:MAG: DnaJ domain-containing protein [Cyanobacteria bacterium P01_H01_bin.121]